MYLYCGVQIALISSLAAWAPSLHASPIIPQFNYTSEQVVVQTTSYLNLENVATSLFSATMYIATTTTSTENITPTFALNDPNIANNSDLNTFQSNSETSTSEKALDITNTDIYSSETAIPDKANATSSYTFSTEIAVSNQVYITSTISDINLTITPDTSPVTSTDIYQTETLTTQIGVITESITLFDTLTNEQYTASLVNNVQWNSIVVIDPTITLTVEAFESTQTTDAITNTIIITVTEFYEKTAPTPSAEITENSISISETNPPVTSNTVVQLTAQTVEPAVESTTANTNDIQPAIATATADERPKGLTYTQGTPTTETANTFVTLAPNFPELQNTVQSTELALQMHDIQTTETPTVQMDHDDLDSVSVPFVSNSNEKNASILTSLFADNSTKLSLTNSNGNLTGGSLKNVFLASSAKPLTISHIGFYVILLNVVYIFFL